ncbi:hypothetical protein BpHYR1_039587 [Brachionus plicatilis]|uniref:Uncharacterized protein n=1 Tax=Brachionus plicatilis TaxID=10195 RepID=A0A3M7QLN5_BRAPC|nr:hypothetical protein BpHYR1_039587 [Brachionus plicatilis]
MTLGINARVPQHGITTEKWHDFGIQVFLTTCLKDEIVKSVNFDLRHSSEKYTRFKISKNVKDFAVCSDYISVLSNDHLYVYSEFSPRLLRSISLKLNIVKTINLESGFEIIGTTDNGKIWIIDKTKFRVYSAFSDGIIDEEINFEGFSDQVKIQILNEEKFELIESDNLTSIEIYSLLEDATSSGCSRRITVLLRKTVFTKFYVKFFLIVIKLKIKSDKIRKIHPSIHPSTSSRTDTMHSGLVNNPEDEHLFLLQLSLSRILTLILT